MSYTPPAGNAVSFNFSGGAYVPPAGNAVVFDLALAQGGGGGGALSSWANITYTPQQPSFSLKQSLGVWANKTYTGQSVTGGTVQTTQVGTNANKTYVAHAPTKFSFVKPLGTNAEKIYTPAQPTYFNGKVTVAGTNANKTYTAQQASNFIKLRWSWEAPWNIWFTTIDVSGSLTYTPQAVSAGIKLRFEWGIPFTISDSELPIKLGYEIPYGFREGWAFEAPYGLASLVQKGYEAVYSIRTADMLAKDFGIVYGTSVGTAWDMRYSINGPVFVAVDWGVPYAVKDFLRIDWSTPYELTQPVQKGFEVNYEIRSVDVVRGAIRLVYSLGADTVIVNTNEPYITYQGRNIRIVEGDISISEGGYTWEGNFVLADLGDYVQFRQDEPFTVNLYGEVYAFVVDGKELRRDGPAQVSARLIGVSPSARFTSPRAIEQDYIWETTESALDVVNSVTAGDIDWGTVNWQVPGFRLSFDNAPAIDVVKALAEAAGAVVESSKAGQLYVRPKYPVSLPDYETVAPAHVYLEGPDILSVSETYAVGEIYNKFRIGDVDLAQNDGMEWVPDYAGGLTGYLRVFPFPFRTDVNLVHTGDGTVFIGPQEVAYNEYDEVVEVFQGQGSVQYPIFTLLEVEFLGDNLGSLVVTPDVREFTVTGPLLNSVIRVRYRTRFLRYRCVSGSGRPTQFLLESAPLT